jgi:hypothetical protein
MSRRGDIALFIMLVLGVTFAGYGVAQLIAEMINPAPAPLAACVSEDSPGPCYWDADTRGNGRGTSFVVTEDDTVIYLPESETK